MVPDGTKSQEADVAFGGTGGGTLEDAGAGVPCIGAHDDAIRVTVTAEVEGVLGAGVCVCVCTVIEGAGGRCQT